jgi:hypothetical protein
MKILIAIVTMMACAASWATDCTKFKTDEDGIPWYMCIASDTKPTGSTVPVGSVAIESDTQNMYMTNAAGSWVVLPHIVSLGTTLDSEDQTNNVMRVEGQFSFCVDDADVVCKASAGFLHSVWCYAEDGTATAGTVRVTNTTAAGGAETTEVWGDDIPLAAYTAKDAVLDIIMTTGIVIDFTTTADVKCGVSYR